ncbi:MAG: phytanoyl-CoA dioxygenase family protein [Hyphomicrobiales bacterium]
MMQDIIDATTEKRAGHRISQVAQTQLKDIQKKLPLRILSEQDFADWQQKGYVVVKNVVPSENIEALKALLWDFEDKDPNDSATWYAEQRRDHAMKELNNAGMVEVYHHQTLWDNRSEQKVYDAFVDIWDQEKLWVTIDRANLNTPNKGNRKSDGFIHWDVDSKLEVPAVSVQGVLSLVHQTGDGDIGGFQCVPYLFEHFDEWVKTQPEDRHNYFPDMQGLVPEKVELEPGDLLIFNSLLAHGVAPNTSDDKVRMAQYISMFPAEPENVEFANARIHSFENSETPPRSAFPGDPRGWEKTKYPQAKLNALGEKLLGREDW